jgi:hypothetical protein
VCTFCCLPRTGSNYYECWCYCIYYLQIRSRLLLLLQYLNSRHSCKEGTLSFIPLPAPRSCSPLCTAWDFHIRGTAIYKAMLRWTWERGLWVYLIVRLRILPPRNTNHNLYQYGSFKKESWILSGDCNGSTRLWAVNEVIWSQRRAVARPATVWNSWDWEFGLTWRHIAYPGWCTFRETCSNHLPFASGAGGWCDSEIAITHH